jgi:hypothetical protein
MAAAGCSGRSAPAPEATFESDIVPILQNVCVRCHTGSDAGELDLSRDDAREQLRARIVPGRARQSYLIEKLSGREMEAERTLEGDAPHPSDGSLAPDELKAFARWIDGGAK